MKARMIDIMVLDGVVALLMGVAIATSGCGETGNTTAADTQMTTEAAAEDASDASSIDTEADAADADNAPTEADAETTDGGRIIKIYAETSYETRTDDDGKALVIASYPTLTCGEESGYDALAASLKTTSDAMKEEAIAAADEFEEYAQDAQQQGYWVEGAFYSYYMNTELVRADSTVASTLITVSANRGGMHPDTWFETHNYDTQTGQELTIQDVLQDGQYEQLAERLATALLGQYNAETFYDEDPQSLLQQEIDENQAFMFTLGQQGITFYFAAYELAPYAAGSQTVTIAYADAPELVKEAYTQAPENYITVITTPDHATFYDADGTTHTLQMTETVDENSEDVYTLLITVDDMVLEDEVMHFDEIPYLVHVDGHNYLYLELSTYNDWRSIKIYDLTNGTLESVGEFDRWFRGRTLCDPSSMELATRSNMLSTNECWRTYKVGADGVPVETQGYDYIDPTISSTLTTKQAMSVQVRDTEDGDLTDATLPAGTELYFYATDGESWVDFKTMDGHYVRINNISTENWPYTVDGVDSETLFDGMAYAG